MLENKPRGFSRFELRGEETFLASHLGKTR